MRSLIQFATILAVIFAFATTFADGKKSQNADSCVVLVSSETHFRVAEQDSTPGRIIAPLGSELSKRHNLDGNRFQFRGGIFRVSNGWRGYEKFQLLWALHRAKIGAAIFRNAPTSALVMSSRQTALFDQLAKDVTRYFTKHLKPREKSEWVLAGVGSGDQRAYLTYEIIQPYMGREPLDQTGPVTIEIDLSKTKPVIVGHQFLSTAQQHRLFNVPELTENISGLATRGLSGDTDLYNHERTVGDSHRGFNLAAVTTVENYRVDYETVVEQAFNVKGLGKTLFMRVKQYVTTVQEGRYSTATYNRVIIKIGRKAVEVVYNDTENSPAWFFFQPLN